MVNKFLVDWLTASNHARNEMLVETEYIDEYLNDNAEEIIKRECVGEVMLLDEALDGDYAGIEQVCEKKKGKERPILFSCEMVKAILAGRKTMSRRIIKEQPKSEFAESPKIYADGKWKWHYEGACQDGVKCPYGKKGDRLYVKEAYRLEHAFDDDKPSEVYYSPVLYLADNSVGNMTPTDGTNGFVYGRYRHARFMPKKFARIWLEITNVRVERLHEITTQDITDEGVMSNKGYRTRGKRWDAFQRIAFQAVWGSIHGQNAWEINPWVWVVEFKLEDK